MLLRIGIWLIGCWLAINASAQKAAAAIDTLAVLAGNYMDDGTMFVPDDSLSAVIPFSRAGNLIVIRARIDGEEGNYILDTGAPGLVLNLTYFRHYATNHALDGGDAQGGITGASHNSSPTKIEDLHIGPFEYKRVSAHRVSLAHLENSKRIRIDGLLGLQLFTRFEMIIDYANNELHLHRISKRESKSYQHRLLQHAANYSVFDMAVKNGLLLTEASIGWRRLSFVLDTGAETTVLDSRLPDALLEQVVIERRVTIAGTGSGKADALYGRLRQLQLGSRVMPDLPVVVTNLEAMSNAFDIRRLDGMLGYDFLARHLVAFNFVTRKMFIWK